MLKEMGVERMEKQLLDALKDTSGERGEAQQMIDAPRYDAEAQLCAAAIRYFRCQ